MVRMKRLILNLFRIIRHRFRIPQFLKRIKRCRMPHWPRMKRRWWKNLRISTIKNIWSTRLIPARSISQEAKNSVSNATKGSDPRIMEKDSCKERFLVNLKDRFWRSIMTISSPCQASTQWSSTTPWWLLWVRQLLLIKKLTLALFLMSSNYQ